MTLSVIGGAFFSASEKTRVFSPRERSFSAEGNGILRGCQFACFYYRTVAKNNDFWPFRCQMKRRCLFGTEAFSLRSNDLFNIIRRISPKSVKTIICMLLERIYRGQNTVCFEKRRFYIHPKASKPHFAYTGEDLSRT